MWFKMHLFVFAIALSALLVTRAEPDAVDNAELVEEEGRANCAQAWKSCDHRPCCVVDGWKRSCRCSLIGTNCECVKSVRESIFG